VYVIQENTETFNRYSKMKKNNTKEEEEVAINSYNKSMRKSIIIQ
jgi:hypothetical protein